MMQVLALTPLRFRGTLGFMPRGGARGQNLGPFFFVESFVFEQQVLFKVESLSLFL